MPSKMHIPRLILFLALAVPFSVLLSSCREQPDEPSTSPSLPILSVEAYWDWAHEQAYKWHTDAQILEVLIKPELPDFPMGRALIEFTFVSPEDRLTEFIFSCTPDGCRTFETEREPGYPSRLCPFVNDDFIIDSKQALAIALEDGISDYLHKELATINLRLSRSIVCLDQVVWRTYGIIPSPFHSTDVWIDAMTGEVIESPYRTEP